MRFFGILILTILINWSRQCIRDETRSIGRIIGYGAVEGQFPYTVFMEAFYGDHYVECSGSLIDPEWVISSAKCVDGVDYTTVYLGAVLKRAGEVAYNVEPSEIIIHPYWNRQIGLNDIALIRIPKPDICYNIFPVPLPEVNSWHVDYGGHTAIASGWSVGDVEQWVRVTVMTKQECDTVHGYALITNFICTYAESSQCSVPDIGGPLVLEDLAVLIGIHSKSIQHNGACVMIYMRVVSYLLWINNLIS